MNEPDILFEVENAVATISFNRPHRMNAQTEASERHFLEALRQADEDPDVRVVIITGTGRAFCSGGDKDALVDIAAAGAALTDMPRPLARFGLSVRKPVVAAINGACAGSGLVYALMADVRFAAEGAQFSTAFVRRGLASERAMTWLLSHIAGQGVARDLLLSGRKFDAREAMSLGLVSRVVDPDRLIPTARSWAADVVENCSPQAIAVIKDQLIRDASNTLEEALADSSTVAVQCTTNADFIQGIASLREGRKPTFEPVGGANPAWRPSDFEPFTLPLAP